MNKKEIILCAYDKSSYIEMKQTIRRMHGYNQSHSMTDLDTLYLLLSAI